MARDDYFKVVYLILDFLYKESKKGHTVCEYEEVKQYLISKKIKRINEDYLKKIIYEIYQEGYIKSVLEYSELLSGTDLEIYSLSITFKGQEYLDKDDRMKTFGRYILEHGLEAFLSVASVLI